MADWDGFAELDKEWTKVRKALHAARDDATRLDEWHIWSDRWRAFVKRVERFNGKVEFAHMTMVHGDSPSGGASSGERASRPSTDKRSPASPRAAGLTPKKKQSFPRPTRTRL